MNQDQTELELDEYRPGEEKAILGVLDACQPGGWGGEATWLWKHRDRPGPSRRPVRARAVGLLPWSGARPVERLAADIGFDGVLRAPRRKVRSAHDRT
jgi:hypothetical protein